MSNMRQQRAAGFAAVELAQRMLQEVAQRRNGANTCVSNDGASGRFDDGGKHAFGWRDAMDVVVRWRQVGEPNDQVRPVAHSSVLASHTPLRRAAAEPAYAASTPLGGARIAGRRRVAQLWQCIHAHKPLR